MVNKILWLICKKKKENYFRFEQLEFELKIIAKICNMKYSFNYINESNRFISYKLKFTAYTHSEKIKSIIETIEYDLEHEIDLEHERFYYD